MSTFNTLVAGTAGVIGWLVVSYLLDRAKKRQDSADDSIGEGRTSSGARPGPEAGSASASDTAHDRPRQIPHDSGSPVAVSRPAPARAPPRPAPISTPTPIQPRDIPGGAGPVSLDEIGRTWHTILGVSSEARADEIERAYYAKLADCDRVRLASDASHDARRNAEHQRALLTQAFEFIRPLRP